jgi:polysaccharide biosynthesis PFTS motif protein
MLWYSVNSIPFNYKDRKLERWVQDTDIYKFMIIDFHWVWTLDHKAYLSKLTNSEILVKGSMVFYSHKHNLQKINYDIVIFDVTPTGGIYSRNSIYNFDLVSKLVMDTLEISKEISLLIKTPINVSIKPKRVYNKYHDIKYVNLLRRLQNDKKIEILDSECNLYDLISSSKLIISYPFTAPAVIGRELKIPSIYYLPKNLLVASQSVHGVPFFQEKHELQKYVLKLFVP